MKRKLILLGLLCIVFTSCAPVREPYVPEISTVTTQVTTTHSTDDPLPPVVGPDISGGLQSGIGEKNNRFAYTEGEDTILNVSLSLPVASVMGDNGLQQSLATQFASIEEELLGRIDQLYQQYWKDYKAGINGLTVPSVQIRFDLHYFTAEAVSMTYIFSETTRDGMVHTDYYHSNLDLRVGSRIRLSALLAEETTDGLFSLAKQKLADHSPNGMYANAEQILSSYISSSWYIANGNLTIFLEAGAIAPLSSGNILITFNESELEGLLSDYGKALI